MTNDSKGTASACIEFIAVCVLGAIGFLMVIEHSSSIAVVGEHIRHFIF